MCLMRSEGQLVCGAQDPQKQLLCALFIRGSVGQACAAGTGEQEPVGSQGTRGEGGCEHSRHGMGS